MSKCERCELPATIKVTGYIYAHELCDKCAGDVAYSLGDILGSAKLWKIYA